MRKTPRNLSILLVDDDPQDRMLIRDAFRERSMDHFLTDLESAEQLEQYLCKGTSSEAANEPALILLDLNLPKKDGRTVLRELKTDPRFKRIPVVILTTSRLTDDVELCYETGANSYITKPQTYGDIVELVRRIETYWTRTVELPIGGRSEHT
jgi:CheY-like chemotaxis protein